MKKLKIFLLLSILLCFGFMLSSEVHAQGGGPKIFEVGDVLPATTQLRISWDGVLYGQTMSIKTDTDNFQLVKRVMRAYGYDLYINDIKICVEDAGDITFNPPYTNWDGEHPYIDIDTTTWPLAKRTVSTAIFTGGESYADFYWEDLNAPSGYTITFNSNGGTIISDIEEATELPTPLPIPTKEGYTFVRWYYDSSFTQIASAGDPIESDVTLYAMWRSNNAKIFEVDDVLPAGYIKISWDLTGYDVGETGDDWMILSDGVPLDLTIDISEIILENTYITMDIIFGGSDPNTGFYESFYLDTPGYTIITLTNPCTITSHDGSADYHEHIGGFIFWEVVSPEYLGDYDDLYDGELLGIEEDYILPQSKVGIKLLYNNTGGPKTGTITYTFGTYGQIILTAQEDNLCTGITSAEITYNFINPNWNIYMIDDSLANQSFGCTRGILFAGVILDFSWATEEERTITDITIEGYLEIDSIFTRILTEEELIYQEGYSDGYTTAREIFGWKHGDDWYNGIDAWNLGEKYARELYGFYDSTTDEWLSVDEYVARYGTGNGTTPTGPSDFYNNFDKYFIPAMIIVFGGAIVLTILKVFKGRE